SAEMSIYREGTLPVKSGNYPASRRAAGPEIFLIKAINNFADVSRQQGLRGTEGRRSPLSREARRFTRLCFGRRAVLHPPSCLSPPELPPRDPPGHGENGQPMRARALLALPLILVAAP